MLKGKPINTSGDLPLKGTIAPDFQLVKSDLGTLGLSELKGKKLILINRNLQIGEQVEILLNELARQKEIEDIFVLPAIRKLMGERR